MYLAEADYWERKSRISYRLIQTRPRARFWFKAYIYLLNSSLYFVEEASTNQSQWIPLLAQGEWQELRERNLLNKLNNK